MELNKIGLYGAGSGPRQVHEPTSCSFYFFFALLEFILYYTPPTQEAHLLVALNNLLVLYNPILVLIFLFYTYKLYFHKCIVENIVSLPELLQCLTEYGHVLKSEF